MRGWMLIPVVLVAAALIGLPAIGLTETGVEKDLKEAIGVNTDECQPTVSLTSPWQPGPSLVEPRDEPRAIALGGKIYLVGGTTGIEIFGDERNLLDPSDQLTVFDPRSGRYRELAPLPEPLNHIGLTEYRGDIYVAGGYGRLIDAKTRKTFYRYDPESNRWSRLPDMPVPRAAGAVGILGHRLIWAGGGKNSIARSDAFAFDFRTQRWSRLPSMPSRREHVAEAVIDGKLYVLGGRGTEVLALDTAERFDPETNRWESLPPMPVASGGVAAVSVDGKAIVVGGGDDGAETVTGAVQEFDPADDKWTLLANMHTARHGHGVAVVGERIWAFGGSDCAYFDATDTVESVRIAAAGRGGG